MTTPIKPIYVDGISQIQYKSGNIKLTMYTAEDSTVDGTAVVETTPILQVVLPADSAIKAITEMSKFINDLIESKKIQPAEQE